MTNRKCCAQDDRTECTTRCSSLINAEAPDYLIFFEKSVPKERRVCYNVVRKFAKANYYQISIFTEDRSRNMIFEYSLKDLNEENQIFFYEMTPYISTHVGRIERKKDAVVIELQEKFREEVESNCNRLKEMITGGKLSNKELPVKTLEDYTDRKPLNETSVFEQLLASGSVCEMAEGAYAYSGIFLKVYKYFIAKISDFGYTAFPDILEYDYPVLYPITEYAEGGYFESFPHYIMFQTVMKNDLDVLERFSKEGVRAENIFEEMKRPVNVMRHAACAPVYRMLANTTVEQDHPKSFLVSGKCFRNESQNVTELSRLDEFLMKEYVFVGTPEQCKENVEKAKDLWKFWLKTFDINSKLDTANDSFFASNYKKLKVFQILGDSKQEFKWQLPASGDYISCSSVNFHRTHFSKPYRIMNDEGTCCYTACFAFGIERLAYALLCQKGIDPDKWDESTREEISQYVSL